MSEYRIVSMENIFPPDNPMRSETLYEGLEELKESLAANGLQQPIGVREFAEGQYKVIWGMRRTFAARELGWLSIPAFVFAEGEGDDETLMSHENFHRTQLNPVEEAEFYARLRAAHNISVSEVARRCRRSVTHVAALLNTLEGDPAVLAALRDGKINQAQARILNQVKDEIGRRLGLGYCTDGGMTARYLDIWRQQRELTGVDVATADVLPVLKEMHAIDYSTNIKCCIHNNFVPLQDAPLRAICDQCWTLIEEAMAEWAENRPRTRNPDGA